MRPRWRTLFGRMGEVEGQPELWGMPLELAVGLVGFGGALLGAFVAAAATIWVARWQARETLRIQRLAKLDDAVMRLGRHLTRWDLGARSESPGDFEPSDEEAEAITYGVIEVLSRSRGLAPGFHEEIAAWLDVTPETAADEKAQASGLLKICGEWLADTSHAPGARRQPGTRRVWD